MSKGRRLRRGRLPDKASGKSVRGRPGLDRAIKVLRPGDVLVLAEWDRATKSMLDGIAIMERVHQRGAPNSM